MTKKINIKELEIIDTASQLYEAFNGFILSPDTKVFGKLLARTLLFNRVKDIPGDIVECGVFKGTGLLTFLKLKRYLCPNTVKRIVGFDFFNSEELIESLSGGDHRAMSTLFKDRNYEHSKDSAEALAALIKGFGFLEHEFELVRGDICLTAAEYCATRPGFRISLLYIDLDLEVPTYDTLCALWDRVASGGVVVFDEYAFHRWSESSGVDAFLKDKDIPLQSLNYICPTACIVKP